MTIFRDRLPATIRIKPKFVPSEVRVHEAASRVVEALWFLLGLALLVALLSWLEA